jgi:hypothetical protein
MRILTKSKPRPRYAYLLSEPDVLYHVYEWYPVNSDAPNACGKIGLWHGPVGEMPVVFYGLDEVQVIWSDAERVELEKLNAGDVKKPSRGKREGD